MFILMHLFCYIHVFTLFLVALDKRCPSVCKCWYDVMDNLKVICEDGWNKTTIENIVPISEAL